MIGMKKVAYRSKVLDLINRFPSKTDIEIAKETGCNRKTVAKYRKETDLKYDTEFVKAAAGKFIKAFGRAEEYWLKQIDRLEELKGITKTVEGEDEDGELELLNESLSPMEILAIEKHQTALQEKILFLASAGRVRQIINMMRVGKIPMLERE